jgi:hypothetical protein
MLRTVIAISSTLLLQGTHPFAKIDADELDSGLSQLREDLSISLLRSENISSRNKNISFVFLNLELLLGSSRFLEDFCWFDRSIDLTNRLIGSPRQSNTCPSRQRGRSTDTG